MASTEQDLIEEALQEFQLRLHSEIPQTRHRHFTEFYDDEAHMEEVARQETATVTNKFIDNITALRVSPGRMGDLVSGLCLKVQAVIDDCLAKNRENKTKSGSFFKKRIDRICDDFKSSMETKLVLNPEMDMKAVEKLLEREKSQGLSYFDYWNHGNVNLYFKQKTMLKRKLNQLKKEMIDKHRGARRPTLSENPNRVEAEMYETASVSVAPASELNEPVSIKVEGLSDIDSDCDSDSTMIAAPSLQVESQKKSGCGNNAGQVQVQEEMENNQQPQSELAIKDEAQSNSMGIKGHGNGHGQKREPIAGGSDSPSKRPRLSEAPLLPGTGINAAAVSDINDAAKLKFEVLSDIDSDSDSSMVSVAGPQIQSQSEVGANGSRLRLQGQHEKRTQPDLDLATKNEAKSNSDPNGIKHHGVEGESITIACSSGSVSPSGKTTAFSSASTESKDPLIFRLADNLLCVGTRIGFQFRQLKDQCIPPAVAVDKNGDLVVGSKAVKCPGHFMLEDCLENLSGSGRKEISFKMGEATISQEVHLEFLLGVLLKTTKDSAESYLKRSFHTAIITVPMWCCSSQRIQIKDAAYIAGFNKAHLINQEIVAVVPFLSKVKGDILVLAENFGIVSGVLYQDRKMVRDEHRRSKRDDSAESKWDKLQSISSALKINQCGGIVVKIMVYATDSRQWGRIFQEFAKRSGSECKFNDHSGKLKFFGASIFCEMTVEEVHATVSQYFPCKLHPYGVDEPIKWLTEPLKCQVPLKYFLTAVSNPRIVQKSVRTGERIPVGEVEFKGSEKYSEEYYEKALTSSMLTLNFKTDYEAIVTLERMEVEKLEGEMTPPEVLLAEDFVWNTPTLKEAERGEVRRLVDCIWLCNEA